MNVQRIFFEILQCFIRMQTSKFVVKCGNFAVLVDLHILPLGGQDNASWFTPEHRKEVVSLIRDALELRVRQFQEARYQKIQPKLRKDLTLTAPLCLEGGNVCLAVHFMKRHVNLRCIIRQQYRELRVFPERAVVCASPPENSAIPNGNLNLDVQATEHCNFKSFLALTNSLSPNLIFLHQNKEVDSRVVIFYGYSSCQCSVSDGWSVVLTGDMHCKETKLEFLSYLFVGLGLALVVSGYPPKKCPVFVAVGGGARQPKVQPQKRQYDQVDKAEKGSAEECHPVHISSRSFLTSESLEEGKAVLSSATGLKRRPRTQSSSGEDTVHQKTKRSRLGEPAASSDSNNPSSDAAAADSVCSLQPEISQTNQSGLAASLRGLSVKPLSSGSSISSRSVAREGKKGGEHRTSRLRRLKKS
ncbi:protein SLX4IP [Carassius carassius]|uniref:protein SLX4IP n=1 Tax=Carassius carassius TaxID=217509 RepID=UPI0028690B1B|nr:protein SLX4IP [Carassius carassius]